MKKLFLLTGFLLYKFAALAVEHKSDIAALTTDSTKIIYYLRSTEKFPDGITRDKISIDYNGKRMESIVEENAKVAFVVNGRLYEEKEFKKLLKKHKNKLPVTGGRNTSLSLDLTEYASVFNL